MTLKLAIAGAGGRMGRMLLEAARTDPALAISAVLEHSASPLAGADAAVLTPALKGLTVRADADLALKGSDVLIDFTRPEASLGYLCLCRNPGGNSVVGTTRVNLGN